MSIIKLTVGRNACAIGIGQSRPTFSWRFSEGTALRQVAYELRIERSAFHHHVVESVSNIDAPWPDHEPDLRSRERARIGVRVKWQDGSWSAWFDIELEVALLSAADWTADFVSYDTSQPASLAKRPFYLRKIFTLPEAPTESARIIATALGVYDLRINGRRFDHVLAPGWQSYKHRLHYQTHVVPADWLREGENELEVVVGEGWYAGRLTWAPDVRNVWGEVLAARVQLEVGDQKVVSDASWEWAYGPLLSSELYDGEAFDASVVLGPWRPVAVVSPPSAALVAPETPPIRAVETIRPIDLISTPSGKTVLDFGQNMVGWVKVRRIPPATRPGQCVRLRFAEVLERGEICTSILRSAKATDTIYRGESPIEDWEPLFTFHGFRYVEVSGMAVDLADFVGVVIHTDMERLGDFDCSHEGVRRLHENVVWGFRGNAVGVPTDCPQRDERMGWTGDLQVFARTACYLYDTAGFLGDWFHDLVEEQWKDNGGMPPLTVPELHPAAGQAVRPLGVWGDVVTMTPMDMYRAAGSDKILKEMFPSMKGWLEGIPRRANGLWAGQHGGIQLGDWLDPKAPPREPLEMSTDPHLVADAYLVASTGILADVAEILGLDSVTLRAEHGRLRTAFRAEYITALGRMGSDSQTAYAVALKFGLLEENQKQYATSRLVHLITRNGFRIGTGFAGTSVLLDQLAEQGEMAVACRMLIEDECPSFLYPISMGATTIWERWDSMKPDGSINIPEMTSFNHYATGAVASFLHSHVGGLSPAEPGWKRILYRPRPGGGLTWARTSHVTPQGLALCEWEVVQDKLVVSITVPVNTTGRVVLDSMDTEVESGQHKFEVPWRADPGWPPKPYAYSPQPRKKR